MNPFRPSSIQGNRSSRRARKVRTISTERSTFLRHLSPRWRAWRSRCLLTILQSPRSSRRQPLPVEGSLVRQLGSPLVATFASTMPLAALSATVCRFPSGTTAADGHRHGTTVGIRSGRHQRARSTTSTTPVTGSPPDESAGVPFTVTVIDTHGRPRRRPRSPARRRCATRR